MMQIKAAADVVPVLDILIVELTAAGHVRLATVLHHRMHQVVWTTRAELFEELRDVITDALGSDEAKVLGELRHPLERVVAVIRDSLGAHN